MLLRCYREQYYQNGRCISEGTVRAYRQLLGRCPLTPLCGASFFVGRLDRESDMAALLEATRPALKDVLGKVYSMSRDQVYVHVMS